MKQSSRFYPRVQVDTSRSGAVGAAGGVLLTETVAAAGLDTALSAALAPWRKPLAVHDPGKVALDLALALALGGDCLADIAVLRAEPGIYGRVASDPTVSRTLDALAADAPAALTAINRARAAVRARVWRLAGAHAPDHDATAAAPLVIDVDATLVTAHSEKESAAPTFKRGFGHHPLWAFVDHGAQGTGEPLAFLLRKGNAGSISRRPPHRHPRRAGPTTRPQARQARAGPHRRGRRHARAAGLADPPPAGLLGRFHPARRPGQHPHDAGRGATAAWSPAYDADGEARPGAWVTELTGLFDLSGWPAGMRLIVRKERPHPGAQLRITDIDGHRITAFVTNSRRGQLADLELRHRRRARAEDRIRCAKDTGLTNLPLHDFAQNEIWCAIVALACELTAWMQTLALTGHAARRWEPKRLRLRLFTVPATLARTGRRRLLHLADHHPWAATITNAIHRLRALTGTPAPAPG